MLCNDLQARVYSSYAHFTSAAALETKYTNPKTYRNDSNDIYFAPILRALIRVSRRDLQEVSKSEREENYQE